MRFKIILTYIVGIFSIISVNGQSFSDYITRSFKVKPAITVEIKNKYGKVHISPWDKDSVRFDINLEMSANNTSKLNRLRNSIDVDFTNTAFYIIAETEFGTTNRGFFSELMDMAEYLLPSDKVTIDYLVHVPRQATVKINNRFGDVFIEDHKGNLSLSLSNGDLKANQLSGKTDVNISSGDAEINFLNDGKLEIAYSDFHVKKANRLIVDSRSSRIMLDKVSYLKAISRRDKYYIRKTVDMFGDSYFSDLNIYELDNELNYSLKYGNINMEYVANNFSFLNINSEYTDIDIMIEDDARYEFDITHNKDVILSIPENKIIDMGKKEVGEEGKEVLMYGSVGAENADSKIKITATKKCIINIMHK